MSYWLGLGEAMGSLAGGEQSAIQPPLRLQPAKIPVPEDEPEEEPDEDPEEEPDEEPEEDPEEEPDEEPEEEPDEDPEEDPDEEPEEDPEEEPEPDDDPEEEPDEDPDPDPLDGPASSPKRAPPPLPAHAPGANAARTKTVPRIPRFIRANLLRRERPSQKACPSKDTRATVTMAPDWTVLRPDARKIASRRNAHPLRRHVFTFRFEAAEVEVAHPVPASVVPFDASSGVTPASSGGGGVPASGGGGVPASGTYVFPPAKSLVSVVLIPAMTPAFEVMSPSSRFSVSDAFEKFSDPMKTLAALVP
jgi:hypothetical protein